MTRTSRPDARGARACGLALGCLFWGCGDDATTRGTVDATPSTPDAALDAGALDAAPPVPDAALDARALDAAPPALDATPPALDAAPLEPDAEPPPECPPPFEGPAPTAGRWSLSMFHFNLQYVAGGSDGFAEIVFGSPDQAGLLDYEEDDLEDRIIEESIVPLLGLLERNPDFALTFEIQGYAADVFRERHPETLTRMQALVAGGQLELASIHWSDQFFLAFPVQDMDRSWALTAQSFERAGLPLSPVVFTQEGQFGPGYAAWLARTRPGAIGVMPRNLVRFWQNDVDDAPLWNVRGLDVVLPRSISNDLVAKDFNFFDDGELLATGDADPYFGMSFMHRPAAVAEYERRLRCAADRGVRIGRIADYVAAVRGAGIAPVDLPPVLDGTWQPQSTRGPLQWMGRAGLWGKHERDDLVLRTCLLASHTIRALELAMGTLSPEEAAPYDLTRDEAQRALLLGQVSDARGINPWYGEVQYGLEHCGAARDQAYGALQAFVLARGEASMVFRGGARPENTRVHSATADLLEFPAFERLPADERPLPFQVRIVDDGGRTPRISTEALLDPAARTLETTVWRVTVEWPAVDRAFERHEVCIAREGADRPWACDERARAVELAVPRVAGHMGLRPWGVETLETYGAADFVPSTDALDDAFWLPVADGWVDLGNGLHMVFERETTYLAVGFPPAGEGASEVRVRDETLPEWQGGRWVFWVTDDVDAAERLANLNLWGRVYVQP